MKNTTPYTAVFEHEFAGLSEHLTPITREWLRRGHTAVIAAPAAELDAVRAAHSPMPQSERLSFVPFENLRIDWPCVHAIINAQPGNPGPVFHDLNGPWSIPRVTINHGLTDKQTTFPSDTLGNTVGLNNVLLACGEAMFRGSWDDYVRKWPEIVHALKIIPVGSPKTDALFDGTYRREEILRALNLPADRPTLLYAPTYQKEASLECCGEEIIRALAGLPVNLLVRLHHFSMNLDSPLARSRGNRGRDWRTVMNALEAQYPNLRHVTGNSNPYFVAADLMISDVSGASFEYILQDKPVLFFDVPAFFEAHGRDGVGFWGRDAGCLIKSAAELPEAVTAELKNPSRRAEARGKLIRALVGQPGGASQRAVDALESLIERRTDYPTWGTRLLMQQERMILAYQEERLARCALETPRAALFGAGAHTLRLLDLLNAMKQRRLPVPTVPVILDDAEAPAKSVRGIPVSRPEAVARSSFDTIILSTDYHQTILRRRCCEVFGSDCPVMDLYEAFPWYTPGKKANDEIAQRS